nr:MAG TPA: hypothetical protein [Caudoviricetes sp.]
MILNMVGGRGGTSINGILQEYVIKDGETISAGDFVEFVHSGFGLNASTGGSINGVASAVYHIAACALSNNKIFLAYDKGYCCIVTIDGAAVSVSTPTQMHTQYVGDVAKLSDDKVLLATGSINNNGKNVTYFSVISIGADETLTAGTVVQTIAGNGSAICSLVVLDETSAACAALGIDGTTYSSTTVYYPYIHGLNIQGTAITITAQTKLLSLYKPEYADPPIVCKVNNHRIAVIYNLGKVDSDASQVHLSTYDLNGGVLSSAVTIMLYNNSMEYTNGLSCAYLQDNYICTLHVPTNSSGYQNSCVVRVYECTGTAITQKAATTVSRPNGFQSYTWIKSISLLDGSCIFVNNSSGYADRFVYNGSAITRSEAVSVYDPSSGYNMTACTNSAPVVIGRNIVLFKGASTSLINYLTYPQEVTTEVKAVSEKISGVAKANGVGGDIIEIITHEVEVI